MIKRLLSLGVFAAMGIAGCASGVGVVSYDRQTTPVLAEAPQEGEYALFAGSDMDPKVSYYLHRGDPLGFKAGKTGEVIAVAGKAEVSEPDGSYLWRRRTGQEGQSMFNSNNNSNSGTTASH